MKALLALILVLAAGTARADDTADMVSLGLKPELAELIAGLSTKLSNAEWIQATDQAGTGTLNLMTADATDDTVINADSGDLLKMSVAKTPVAAIGAPTPAAAFTPQATADFILNGKVESTSLKVTGTSTLGAVSATDNITLSSGKQVIPPVAVITPSTDMTPIPAAVLGGKFNVIATAAPTRVSVMLPAATASVGKEWYLYNKGASPVEIYPNGTDQINLGGAATPVSVAAKKTEKCFAAESGNSVCTLEN